MTIYGWTVSGPVALRQDGAGAAGLELVDENGCRWRVRLDEGGLRALARAADASRGGKSKAGPVTVFRGQGPAGPNGEV